MLTPAQIRAAYLANEARKVKAPAINPMGNVPIVNEEEPPTVKLLVLNDEDRAYWNGFTDFVSQKGLAGSPKLDERDTNLSRKLFDEYNKAQGAVYKYDQFVPAIQREIADYRGTLINKVKGGQMKMANPDGTMFNGDVNTFDYENNYMPGLSNVDGWAGSKTTGFKFPGVQRKANEISPQRYKQLYGSKK